jgi:flagellar protein FliO/FliZ
LLHRNYLILLIVSLFVFSSQGSIKVLAEVNDNESVYENINQAETEKSTNETPKENEQKAEKIIPDEAGSITAFDFIKIFVALAFVLFLIYFLLKFVTKRNRMFQKDQSIVNIGGTSLGQSKSIQMVKIGDRVLVVGVGESISLLKEIDDEEERKKLIEDFERKQDQVIETRHFIQMLSKIFNKNSDVKVSKEYKVSFSTSFKEQLEKIKQERTKQIEDVKRKGLNKHE